MAVPARADSGVHRVLRRPGRRRGVVAPNQVRLGRDDHVRLDSCDYSVHPGKIRHHVEVAADWHTCGFSSRMGRCRPNCQRADGSHTGAAKERL